jgi:hypothetical protein
MELGLLMECHKTWTAWLARGYEGGVSWILWTFPWKECHFFLDMTLLINKIDNLPSNFTHQMLRV